MHGPHEEPPRPVAVEPISRQRFEEVLQALEGSAGSAMEADIWAAHTTANPAPPTSEAPPAPGFTDPLTASVSGYFARFDRSDNGIPFVFSSPLDRR